MRLQIWAQAFAHGLHGLWLDRQHDHVDALDGLGIVGKGVDTVLGADARTGVGARVAGADLRGVQALGP